MRGIVPTSRDWFVDGRLIVRKGDGRRTIRWHGPSSPTGQADVVPDDLLARAKDAVPQVESVAIHTGVRVGGRLVWAIAGVPETRNLNDFRNYFVACCGESGAAVDLTRFKGGLNTQLFFPRRASGIEPTTLRGRQPLATSVGERSPGAQETISPATVCATIRQMEVQTSSKLVAATPGGATAWERGASVAASSRRMRGHMEHRPRVTTSVEPREPEPPTCVPLADASVHEEIRIVRGDARGGRARELRGAIRVANEWPPGTLGSAPACRPALSTERSCFAASSCWSSSNLRADPAAPLPSSAPSFRSAREPSEGLAIGIVLAL